MNYYRAYGLTLSTNLQLNLPAATRADNSVRLVAVEHRIREVGGTCTFENGEDWVHQSLLEDGSLYCRWGEVFELLACSDGSEVICHNLTNAPLGTFEAYLTNFAVTAALLQRHEEPLHATAVHVDGLTIGLLGASGAGKSTLAASFLHNGGELITDDLLRIAFHGQRAIVYPGPYRIKLFEEPAKRFLPNGTRAGSWDPDGEKLILKPNAPPSDRSTFTVSALFALNRGGSDDEPLVSVDALRGSDLITNIVGSSMNTRLDTTARLSRQFWFATRLSRTVPIFRMKYRNGFEFLPEVRQAMLAQLKYASHGNND